MNRTCSDRYEKERKPMSGKRARIELIDIAKAFTIILVIQGHTTGNLETPMYRRLIYSFHMPLFFFWPACPSSPGR